MRKKLAILTFVVSIIVAGGFALQPASAAHKGCPKGSHLVTCPSGNSFCCPNNALCVCFP